MIGKAMVVVAIACCLLLLALNMADAIIIAKEQRDLWRKLYR